MVELVVSGRDSGVVVVDESVGGMMWAPVRLTTSFSR